MRNADYINELWNNGGAGPNGSDGFSGEDGKAHTIVTVQRPWDAGDTAVRDGDEDHVIHPTWTKCGNSKVRGWPLRWYQKLSNDQNEDEVPNVKSVTIDRSVEQDAATCQITLYNQWMYDNGLVPLSQLAEGNRQLAGYFTPTRGTFPEGAARWGHQANEWENTLVPNAVIRTYQGYGGHSKTRAECIEDGNLILTGIWLVDEVRVSSGGELEISCRDMAKLLVDQQLYPPLVPSDKYPLTYYRWVYDNFVVAAGAKTVTSSTTASTTIGNKRCVFRDSEVDRWYPQGSTGSQISSGGYLLHGHKGAHAIDGNSGTYYLGVGNAGPDRDFSVMWIEFSCGEYINAVYLKPWAGNFQMYISVMEGGVWQGASTIPYSEAELVGNQSYVVDTGADIKYVAKFGVPWETGKDYPLPRYYKADRVRISFRHLAYSGIGPWYYRGGVREVKLKSTQATKVTITTSTQTLQPILFAADSHPVAGYITGTNLWQIDAFGDARTKPADSSASTSTHLVGLRFTPGAQGYYGLDIKGKVLTFGDATWLGDPKTTHGFQWVTDDDGALDMAVTPSGNGYWVLTSRNKVYEYGDATNFTTPAMTGESGLVSIESHPSGNGYWVLDGNGKVTARGACTDYGDFTEASLNFNRLTENFDQQAVCLRATSTGNGYWILTNSGRIQAFGDADDFGGPQVLANADLTFFSSYARLLKMPDDDGYAVLRGDGRILGFGNWHDYGSPVAGTTGQLRRDGNYKDYSDIIRDLALWSGFLLYDDAISATAAPAVYGNIESTGAYAEEQLPDEIFDKRPVIDAMTELKEVVGYLLFVDDEGGLRFESPNFWAPGNFIQSTGERVEIIPEIDERVSLIDYGASRNDESLRSLIIISSEDPNEAGDTTVTTKIVPQTATGLRGILRPAMWINGWFQHEDEQKIMAELIALHIWFAQRIGQVTCVANPAIQINDQVRIYERITAELFMHYVRGVNTTHNLDSGEYTMTLTTHWLGSGEDWAITDSPAYSESDDHFVISPLLQAFIESSSGLGSESTSKGTDPSGLGGDLAAGSGPED